MKNDSTSWMTALISVVVGIILIVLHGDNSLLNWVVEVIGALVALVGVCVVAAQLLQKKGERNYLYILIGIVAAAAGAWLMADAAFFVRFVIYVLATVLIIAGLWHMLTLKTVRRTYPIPVWLWVIPAIMLVAGFTFLFTGARIAAGALVLIVGICLILSACNSFMENVNRMRNRDRLTTTTGDKAS